MANKTDDWAKQNAEGRRMADAALGELRDTGNVPAFVALIREMAGRVDGQAVGFLSRLAARAI